MAGTATALVSAAGSPTQHGPGFGVIFTSVTKSGAPLMKGHGEVAHADATRPRCRSRRLIADADDRRPIADADGRCRLHRPRFRIRPRNRPPAFGIRPRNPISASESDLCSYARRNRQQRVWSRRRVPAAHPKKPRVPLFVHRAVAPRQLDT
jgi:hypothetical protein